MPQLYGLIWGKSWFPPQWSREIIPLCRVSLRNVAQSPISLLHPHLQVNELWITSLSSQLERSSWCANYTPGNNTRIGQVVLRKNLTPSSKDGNLENIINIWCFAFQSNTVTHWTLSDSNSKENTNVFLCSFCDIKSERTDNCSPPARPRPSWQRTHYGSMNTCSAAPSTPFLKTPGLPLVL